MRAWLLAAVAVVAPASFAARITDVADAGDEKHPLEVDLEATYTHLRSLTTLTREQTTAAGTQLNDELKHVRTLDAIELRLAVGIWHDLELHVFAPLALRDQQSWNPASGTSTLSTNTISVSGCAAAGSCTTVQPIMPIPGQSQRTGFGDPTVGITWGPINEERELRLRPELFPPGKPVSTWVIALSASAPFAAPGGYDDCSHPELLSDVATANCKDARWAGQTRYKPPYEAQLTLGAELVAAEDVKADERLSFEVRGDVRWHGPARDYTQVADALGKLTYADEYVTTMGTLGIYGRVARWLHLRVYGSFGVDTAHFVTHEDIGEDKDRDGIVTVSGGNGLPAPDQNPLYDYRLDQVGRRLRAEPTVTWGFAGTLSLNF